MELTKKEYQSQFECLYIDGIRLGKLNPSWLLEMNNKYSPTLKDRQARIKTKQLEKNQITIKIY